MSQKKHKKRHPQAKRRVSAPVEESEFASDGTRKRMNGTTRNILLFALILLAATGYNLLSSTNGILKSF